MPMESAMAMRCKNALVEPPSAMTTAMAFSNACVVMMSFGVMPSSISRSSAAPAASTSLRLASDSAGLDELPGRLMPMASMAAAMVLAVYMPPHEPGPGQAWHSMAYSSSSSMRPWLYLPTASKALTMSMSQPLSLPGRMVPPYTKMAGVPRRPMAIMQPGMFLSQPPMASTSDCRSASPTASYAYATHDRLCREET